MLGGWSDWEEVSGGKKKAYVVLKTIKNFLKRKKKKERKGP